MRIPTKTIAVGAVTAALALTSAYADTAPICGDVNVNGQVQASDALLVLKKAVGQPVDLMCASSALLLKTGETTSFGPGSDGSLQAGVPRSLTDNGDGTITDHATGLMWEKKDQGGSVHDVDLFFTWTSGSTLMDGTMVTEFLELVNEDAGFAGYTDWRIPNQFELFSILDFGEANPSVPAEFDTNCNDPCTYATCSCTRSDYHWSSTSVEELPGKARSLSFGDGATEHAPKGASLSLRAVRNAW
ncbi:MAG: DUF1566 domain-containing protein [Candidatus Binatia bacterium]